MSVYAKPLPRIDERNRGHWDGARENKLLVQKCGDCGALRYPSSRLCAKCQSEVAGWVEVSGKGTVWSWCVFHRAYFEGFKPEIPYAVVLVQLDEGPKLYSNLMGVPKERIRIGMRVKAVFERVTDEATLVKFAEAKS